MARKSNGDMKSTLSDQNPILPNPPIVKNEPLDDTNEDFQMKEEMIDSSRDTPGNKNSEGCDDSLDILSTIPAISTQYALKEEPVDIKAEEHCNEEMPVCGPAGDGWNDEADENKNHLRSDVNDETDKSKDHVQPAGGSKNLKRLLDELVQGSGKDSSNLFTRRSSRVVKEVKYNEESDCETDPSLKKTKAAVDKQEQASKKAFLHGFQCDGCDSWLTPATGRFSCMVCPDFDVCTECMLKGVHSAHALVRLIDKNTLVPTANGAVKLGTMLGTGVKYMASKKK